MKVGIILGSNEVTSVEFASFEASVRTSIGDEVDLFVTMDGIRAFQKEAKLATNKEMSQKIGEKNTEFRKYLLEGKESELLKIYVCSYAADLYHIGMADLDEIVDAIWGLTKFNLENENSMMISVW